MRKFEAIFLVILLVFSTCMLIIGTGYGLQDRYSIGAGFFPVVSLALVILGCVLRLFSLFRERKNPDKPFFSDKNSRNVFLGFLVVYAVFLICTQFLGLLPSAFLFMFVMFKFFEKKSVVNSLLVALGTSACLYLIFDVMLNLHLDMGIFA